MTQIQRFCPRCGERLVEARNRKSGESYLACPSIICDFTEETPQDVQMRRMGAPTLFGEENS